MARRPHIPKVVEKIAIFFTLFLLAQAVLLIYMGLWPLAILVIYFEPPLIWRMAKAIWGQPEGVSYLGTKTEHGNLWWVAFHLQNLFNTFHFFEQFLMLFPGLYSFWLRLWGSEIGTKVNWTPESRLVDRTHLKIGNRVLIGNRSYLAGHAIKKRGDKYLLYVKGVEIGDDAVLAYSVTIAPGAKVAARAFIEAGKAVYPNETAGEEDE